MSDPLGFDITDAIDAENAAKQSAPPNTDSSFRRGLRSNLTAAGGQLNELAGGVGESLGFSQFAKDRYAASRVAQVQAEEEAPSIRKFSDVHNPGDFINYAGGMAGGALPVAGAALGAAALARTPLRGLLAATAATAPLEIGGTLQASRNDPVASQKPINEQLGNAMLYGTGKAAIGNIVPVAAAGQLFGKAASVAGRGALNTVARTVATDAAGNALAGNVASRVGQFGEAQLDPNRDTSHDAADTSEATIGGGLVGGVMGVVGGTGAALHGRPKADVSIVRKIANDESLVPNAKTADHVALSDKQAVEHTKGYVSELLDNTSIGPEIKQKVAEASQNLGDAANRAYIAGQKLAADAHTSITDLYQKVVNSDNYSSVSGKVSDVIEHTKGYVSELLDNTSIGPEIKQKVAEASQNLGDSANRAYITAQKLAADAHTSVTGMYQKAANSEGYSNVRSKVSDVIEHTKGYVSELLDNTSIGPEIKQKVAKAAQNLGDSANRAYITAQKLAADAHTSITDLYQKVVKPDASAQDSNVKRSEDYSGVRSKISDIITPLLEKRPELTANPQNAQMLADTMRVVIDNVRAGDRLPPKTMSELNSYFGDALPDTLLAIHEAVKGSEPSAQTATFYNSIAKLTGKMERNKAMHDVITKNLVDDSSATTPQVSELVGRLREHVRRNEPVATDTIEGQTKSAERKLRNSLLDREMTKTFGENKDKVIKAFQDESEGARTEQARSDAQSESAKDHANAGVKDETLTEGDLKDSYETPTVYGGKEGNPFTLSHEAHVRDFGNGDSQSKRLLAEAKEANPDRNVSAIAAKEYAAENDISTAKLHEMTGGKPDDHVVVAAEGMKQEGRLTRDQVERMKLDTRNRGDDKSRITTDKGSFDAVKITREMKRTMPRVEGEDGLLRTARAFHEGVGGVLDATAGKVKGTFPDDLVIARYGEGKSITFKDIKGLKDASLSQADGRSEPRETHELRRQVRALDTLIDKLETTAETAKGDYLRKIKDEIKFNTKMRDNLEQAIEGRDAASTFEEYKSGNTGDGTKRNDPDRHGLDNQTYRESSTGAGLTEVPPDGQIHLAVTEHGEGKVRNQFDLSGKPIEYANPDPNKPVGKDGKLTIGGKMELQKRFEALPSSAAAKGDALLGKVYAMEAGDHLKLASLIGRDDVPRANKIINEMTEKYAKVADFDRRFEAVVSKVISGGDGLKEVLARVKRSDNTVGMQQSVKAMLTALEPYRATAEKTAAGKTEHDNLTQAIEATNARIAQVLKDDPTKAYGMKLKSMEGIDPSQTVSGASQKAIKAYLETVAPHLAVSLAKDLGYAGEFHPDVGQGLIRISIHATDPLGTAYHESLHSFFKTLRDEKNFDAMKILYKAAEGTHALEQMRKLLKNEPEALKQIETNPEERVAYMYQFWSKDQGFKLGPAAKNVFAKIKDAILKAFGLWTNDQRAEHIMDFFHSGQYAKISGDRSAVTRALMEPGTNKYFEKTKAALEPLKKLEQAVFGAGSSKLRDTYNPAFAKIADLMQPNTHGSTHDEGFIGSSRAERTQRLNILIKGLKGMSEADLEAGHLALREGRAGDTPAEQQVVRTVRKTLDAMYGYMRAADVAVGDMGAGKDYFPRIWDTEFVSKNQDAFRNMLNKYVANGQFKGDVEKVMNKLMARDGAEVGVEVNSPGMQHIKERSLSFITGDDAAPFLQKSLFATMNSYVTQATRRAEWARRFKDDGSGLKALLDEASSVHGATPEQMSMAHDFLRGVDGTLGDNINPTARRMMGNMIAYQNLRLLPLMVFSSLVDPLGIAVRGGTIHDAFGAFKRGIAEIPRGFKKENHADQWYQLAQDMGTIDDTALVHTLGSSYSQGMVSSFARGVNDTLFKFNLGEQFNTSMRVSATQAASKFLAKHADGSHSTHSVRWLAELGLKPGEVKLKDGQPLLTVADFMASGMDETRATLASNKMRHALNQWVDGAVLRPNAADRPIWFNDPHFALFSHLKQFTYSFQHTILNRVANETAHGNYAPAAALATYVPTMIAADLVKGFIQGGGQQPDWKKDWGMSDYLMNGWERAGLNGVGQFPSDFVKDIRQGGAGIGAIAGPTFEQLTDSVKTVAGHEQFKTFAINSAPANVLYKHFLSETATPDTKFSE